MCVEIVSAGNLLVTTGKPQMNELKVILLLRTKNCLGDNSICKFYLRTTLRKNSKKAA